MNDKLKSLYDGMTVWTRVHEQEFLSIMWINGDKLVTHCPCSKYAKFVINDFKSMENEYGRRVYDEVDPEKIKVMFSISEQYSWFTRKDLLQFIDHMLNKDVV